MADAGDDVKTPPWKFIAFFLSLSLLLVVGFGASVRSWSGLAALLLLGAASLAVGGFLGFLFGIPRASAKAGATNNTNAEADSRDPYEPSNSLEQVADWLTKILVGAGLVELGGLRDSLVAVGDNLQKSFAIRGIAVASQLVVVLYLVIGFISSFLWTRLYYGSIQAGADLAVHKLFQLYRGLAKRVAITQGLSTALAKEAFDGKAESERALETAPSAARAADPIAALPASIRRKIEQLRDWDPTDWDSDPCAELFPDSPQEANGLRFEATIVRRLSNALAINLHVEPTAEGKTLAGPVVILLHPTFSETVEVALPRDGVADDRIFSGGAFTVIAIADAGKTILGYDLAQLPGAPQWFIEG